MYLRAELTKRFINADAAAAMDDDTLALAGQLECGLATDAIGRASDEDGAARSHGAIYHGAWTSAPPG